MLLTTATQAGGQLTSSQQAHRQASQGPRQICQTGKGLHRHG
jgi:hypothetical protein